MNWEEVYSQTKRPRPFEPAHDFWSDSFLGPEVVFNHFEDNDDGSRPQAVRARELEWIDSQVLKILGRRGRCLDLGCGPGLYGLELARRGWTVEGWDCNPSSVEYAREWAEEEGFQSVSFYCKDMLKDPFPSNLDLILIVYGTLGTFSPDQARDLIRRAAASLRPGGVLLFDVFTESYVKRIKKKREHSWAIFPRGGFWSAEPYALLTQKFSYGRENAWLRQYCVLSGEGVKTYRLWYHWLESQSVRNLLPQGGQCEYFGSLEGGKPQDGQEWLGVLWVKDHVK